MLTICREEVEYIIGKTKTVKKYEKQLAKHSGIQIVKSDWLAETLKRGRKAAVEPYLLAKS